MTKSHEILFGSRVFDLRNLGVPVSVAIGTDGVVYVGDREAGRVDAYDGVFSGCIEKTYTITISNGGESGIATLPLEPAGSVACVTCHSPHFSDSGGANGGQDDGYILRQSMNDICFACHTLADTARGSHLDSAGGALWPGGEYGSSFPAHSADKRGACINCQRPVVQVDVAAGEREVPPGELRAGCRSAEF